MKISFPMIVAAVVGSSVLAGCGSTSAECVDLPYDMVAVVESGLSDRSVSFGSYGGTRATPIGSGSDSSSDISAYLVAVELDGWPDGEIGVWKVGKSDGSHGPIFAANSLADEVGEWPLIRNFDDSNADAISCIWE